MNALASLTDETDFSRCSIWSTHVPCAMCEAAIEFAGLSSTHYLADDPSSEDADAPRPVTAPAASIWTVVANVMFLHNVAWVGGRDAPIVARYARREPEIAALALRVLDDQIFIRASTEGADLPAGLASPWESLIEVTEVRAARG
jgi:hypothetical protein